MCVCVAGVCVCRNHIITGLILWHFELRCYQKPTELCKLHCRLMRETAQDLEIDPHSQSTASGALQETSQAAMATFLKVQVCKVLI